jgi:fructose-bisphosphate aldolase / 6-deoxy-5-ketofructose 1-phosphate synthase
MKNLSIKDIDIPLTVPQKNKKNYLKNYLISTKNTGRLFLFAGDQKIEHLNKDFYSPNISVQNATPKHMFDIASKGSIGVFATQLGLIARYGQNYPDIKYIIKLNAKTDIIPVEQKDPISLMLVSVEEVVEFKKNSNLDIVGVGYTIYLGSEHEAVMLSQASQIIYQAHKHGLLVILWIYPRGKSLKNPYSAEIIAGAAGVGACLGADFIKVNPPVAEGTISSEELLKQATLAAGKSRVICSGGKKETAEHLLKTLYQQIHTGGAVGAAIGRNLHQRDLDQAIKLSNAIAAIIFNNANFNTAKNLLT